MNSSKDEKVMGHAINEMIDKLTLNSLILMEQQMQSKINLENAMADGELHLAKSRYIMGHKNVSCIQLPNTADKHNIEPIVFVEELENDKAMLGSLSLKVTVKEKLGDGNEKGIHDPIKWFGLLVPSSLHFAQKKFQSATSWAVDCANLQIKLHQTLLKLYQLKTHKRNSLINIFKI